MIILTDCRAIDETMDQPCRLDVRLRGVSRVYSHGYNIDVLMTYLYPVKRLNISGPITIPSSYPYLDGRSIRIRYAKLL